MQQPELIIIGGANGSGKTTLAREIIAQSGIKYLGADEIATEINKLNPEKVAIEAARIFSHKFGESIESSESLIVESTLSGVSLKKFLIKAQAKHFKVSIYFIYLDSAELCIKRVASRVALGGHHVPPTDVRRRFSRSNHNFWKIYQELANDWNLFLNVGDDFQQVAVGDEKGVIVIDEARYRQWLKMVM